MKKMFSVVAALALALLPNFLFASEADLKIPELTASQNNILMYGFGVIILGMIFAYYQFRKVRKLKAHQSMLDVSKTIFETCKTYLLQQGKLLLILFIIIGLIVVFYFGFLEQNSFGGGHAYSFLDGNWNLGFLLRSLVRNSYEHACK